jgi:hypothetical protein
MTGSRQHAAGGDAALALSGQALPLLKPNAEYGMGSGARET